MNDLLICSHLSKRYGSFQALSDINLSLNSGRIIGLLGPNGSGKTTLIKLLNGLLTPSEGSIQIGGMPVGPKTKAIVSYLPDKNYLPPSSKVSDLLNLFSDFYADFNQNRALEMLKNLNIQPSSRLKAMSKGTLEKVQLVLVMSRNAKLYILDEPIAGVDPAARDYILRTIIQNYNEDASVLISTHLIADIEPVLDDVIFLKEGQISLTSSVDDIRENEGKSVDELFREVFRC